MKTLIVETAARQVQFWMYDEMQSYGYKYPCLTRTAGVLVALADTCIDTLKHPLKAIEGLAVAIINLLGVLLCLENWTIKGFLINIEKSAVSVGRTPIALILSPFKFVYQTAMIMYNPSRATTYSDSAQDSKYNYDPICKIVIDPITTSTREF